jgi:polysaccharide biosynthesis/export protein
MRGKARRQGWEGKGLFPIAPERPISRDFSTWYETCVCPAQSKDKTMTASHAPQDKPANTRPVTTGYGLWFVAQRLLAATMLVLLSPLFLLLYPAIRLTSPGPFLYSQARPGQHGVPFRAYKLRTMRTGADRNTDAARSVRSGDPMVTPVGRILRTLKIDEAPQLFNVVRGEMALVGPRPIALSFQQELEAKIPGFSARLLVKPGLSSLPQVCVLESQAPDRVVEDWSRRFRMERHYIANQSVAYDLVVIGLTVALILRTALVALRQAGNGFRRRLSPLMPMIALTFLAGCSAMPAGGLGDAPALTTITPVSAESTEPRAAAPDVSVSHLKAKPFKPEKADPDYRVGEGDVLKINVFGETGMNDLNIRVEADGRIQLPAIESPKVSGLTLREIQKKLTAAYRAEFNEPWVMVTMASYGSRPVYLLGEFNNPGVSFMDRPTNLLNAVALGKGTTGKAYMPGARVIRGDAILPVDIKSVLKDGRLEQNIWLKGGDTIFIPSSEELKCYVVGAVQSAGAFPCGEGQQTLARVLASAGGPVNGKASLGAVRIIRTLSPVEGQVLSVDAARILKGESPDVALRPDDIVFVPQTALSRWNDVVQQVLPTLSLVGAPIQPFMILTGGTM